LKTNLKQSRKH